MKLDISKQCISWLAANAYSPQYGARPLKRAIEEYILDPLSLSIIEGTVEEGDTIRIRLLSKDTHQITDNIDNGVITIMNKKEKKDKLIPSSENV